MTVKELDGRVTVLSSAYPEKNMLTGGKPAPWMADLPEELGYDDGV